MPTKAEIIAAARFKEETVVADGVTFLVREFNGAQRDSYEQGMVRLVDGKREADLSNMRAKLIAPSLVAAEGEEPWSVDEVASLPSSLIEPLWDAAQRVNGLGAEAADTAAKN